ncbi:MAG: glycosyltransferase family 2 protein [Bacteroidetes bacterium]|nr:glycosyltransferase family 2 protein [Bacteroidota bacterium]
MKSEVDVSICIVNHKHRDLLSGCLDSVLKNTEGLSCRIVVLDNNSCDGSVPMIETSYPTVYLVQNSEQHGFATNQNMMLRQEMALSRYVMMLNDDTVMNDGCLRSLVSFMDAHPAAGAVAAQLLWKDGSIQVSATAFPSALKEIWRYSGLNRFLRNDGIKKLLKSILGKFANREVREYLKSWGGHEPRRADALCGGAMMMRAAALKDVGLLDEGYSMYYEDVDWCRRSSKRGWENWIVPNATVIHFGGSSSSSLTRVEWEKSMLRYFSLYHGRRHVLLLRFGLLAVTSFKAMVLPIRWLFSNKRSIASDLEVYLQISQMAIRKPHIAPCLTGETQTGEESDHTELSRDSLEMKQWS